MKVYSVSIVLSIGAGTEGEAIRKFTEKMQNGLYDSGSIDIELEEPESEVNNYAKF